VRLLHHLSGVLSPVLERLGRARSASVEFDVRELGPNESQKGRTPQQREACQ